MSALPTSKNEIDLWKQKLTPSEEQIVFEWIKKLAAWGFPARRDILRDLVVTVLNIRLPARQDRENNEVAQWGNDDPALGQKWMFRFLARHEELGELLSHRLDEPCASSENPAR